MFRKVLIFAMFATAAGYCFAAETLPQVVTSEVFYEQENTCGHYNGCACYRRCRIRCRQRR